jgi:hypothetical protein
VTAFTGQGGRTDAIREPRPGAARARAAAEAAAAPPRYPS